MSYNSDLEVGQHDPTPNPNTVNLISRTISRWKTYKKPFGSDSENANTANSDAAALTEGAGSLAGDASTADRPRNAASAPFVAEPPEKEISKEAAEMTTPYVGQPDRIWTRYNEEATKFDKVLIESWKVDTDGALIFIQSGLLSAVITGFLIVSLQLLQPNSGDATVALLLQISSQLVQGSQASAASLPPVVDTSVDVILINSLWIASLVFALATVSMALHTQSVTLMLFRRSYPHSFNSGLDYYHAVTRDIVPETQSRTRISLYAGVERFGMQYVVAAVPLILQLSVFLFLAGLVLYIRPMNTQVFEVALGMTAAVSGAYCVLSLLPVLYERCPFKTPISWMVGALLKVVLRFIVLTPIIVISMLLPLVNRDSYFEFGEFSQDVTSQSWAWTKERLIRIRDIRITPNFARMLGVELLSSLRYGMVSTPRPDYVSLAPAIEWLINTSSSKEHMAEVCTMIVESQQAGHQEEGFLTAFGSTSVNRRLRREFSMCQYSYVNTEPHQRARENQSLAFMGIQRLFSPRVLEIFALKAKHCNIDDWPTGLHNNATTGALQRDSSKLISCHAICTSVIIACHWMAFKDQYGSTYATLQGPWGGISLIFLNIPFRVNFDDRNKDRGASPAYILMAAGLLHAVMENPDVYQTNLTLTSQSVSMVFKGFVQSQKGNEDIAASRLLFMVTLPVLAGVELPTEILDMLWKAYSDAIVPPTDAKDSKLSHIKDKSERAGEALAYKKLQQCVDTNPPSRNVANCQQLLALLSSNSTMSGVFADSGADLQSFLVAVNDIPAIPQGLYDFNFKFKLTDPFGRTPSSLDNPKNLVHRAHRFVLDYGKQTSDVAPPEPVPVIEALARDPE